MPVESRCCVHDIVLGLASWLGRFVTKKWVKKMIQKWSNNDSKNFQILVKKVPQKESEIWPLTDPG